MMPYPPEFRKLNKDILERAETVISILPSMNASTKVLDIGCGHAIYGGLLPTKEYYPIDFVRYHGVSNNFKKVDLNLGKLPFKESSFDVVICTEVLEHVLFASEMCEEIKRVLKKGGVAVISLPNEITIDNRIRCLFGLYPPPINPLSHHWFFTISSAKEFIGKNFKGFKLIKKKYLFGVKGGRFIPRQLRAFIASLAPTLFAVSQIEVLQK